LKIRIFDGNSADAHISQEFLHYKAVIAMVTEADGKTPIEGLESRREEKAKADATAPAIAAAAGTHGADNAGDAAGTSAAGIDNAGYAAGPSDGTFPGAGTAGTENGYM
jgi:hypothetical protein